MAKPNKIKFLSGTEITGMSVGNSMFGYEVPETLTPNSLFFLVEDLPETTSEYSQSLVETNKIKFLSDIETPKLFANYRMFGNTAPETIGANELFFMLNADEEYDCAVLGHLFAWTNWGDYSAEWNDTCDFIISFTCAKCGKSCRMTTSAENTFTYTETDEDGYSYTQHAHAPTRGFDDDGELVVLTEDYQGDGHFCNKRHYPCETTGHEYEYTPYYDNDNESPCCIGTCKYCGDIVYTEKHDNETIESVSATCNNYSYESWKCRVCGLEGSETGSEYGGHEWDENDCCIWGCGHKDYI